MPSKTINITAAKWARVKEAFCTKFPVPTGEDGQLEFTESEWVFVYIKRYFARIVRSHELDRQGTDNALDFDEDMITIT